MDFFQLSTGKWRSQRTTHHLPFQRAETGDSEIEVEALAATHPKIIEICEFHQVDSSLAVGGALASWQGSMAWDREGENHEGTILFALVPDVDNRRQGRLLRDRGYLEIVPVIGRYHMDNEDGLVLSTEYETMSSVERLWFISPNLRLRAGIVKSFGGFSTASFCAETRIGSDQDNLTRTELMPENMQAAWQAQQPYSVWGW
nr:phycobiliprotein lyase [Halomicronema hongdechloris]